MGNGDTTSKDCKTFPPLLFIETASPAAKGMNFEYIEGTESAPRIWEERGMPNTRVSSSRSSMIVKYIVRGGLVTPINTAGCAAVNHYKGMGASKVTHERHKLSTSM